MPLSSREVLITLAEITRTRCSFAIDMIPTLIRIRTTQDRDSEKPPFLFCMLGIVLGKVNLDNKKEARNLSNLLILFGSGERIRTSDLWVMSPTSYQTAPPRDMAIFKTGDFTPLSPIFVKELF